jgi:hypothetical protein
LDGAFEYAAITGDDPFLKLAFMGLTGLYTGSFSGIPYYIKIKEYNNAENRDIFEYDLNLEREDVEFLLRHLWEMQQARLHYLFLTRNCSYEILALLEAAKPEWELLTGRLLSENLWKGSTRSVRKGGSNSNGLFTTCPGTCKRLKIPY